MKSEIGNRTAGRRRRLGSGVARAVLFSSLLLTGAGSCVWAQHSGQGRPAPPPRPVHSAPAPSRPPVRPAPAPSRAAGQPSQRYQRGVAPAANEGRQPGYSQPQPGGFPTVPGESFMGRPSRSVPGIYPGSGRPGQEHLPQWLNQHQNLPLSQQEQALRREPGFNRLPPAQQQRYLDRLRSLDSRPPAVRQRMLARNEMFERLSPEGRQEVRAAAQAMKSMPGDRRMMVSRAFNDLRRMPPGQRAQILNSARFSHDFSPQERHVLGNLLSIEPYQSR